MLICLYICICMDIGIHIYKLSYMVLCPILFCTALPSSTTLVVHYCIGVLEKCWTILYYVIAHHTSTFRLYYAVLYHVVLTNMLLQMAIVGCIIRCVHPCMLCCMLCYIALPYHGFCYYLSRYYIVLSHTTLQYIAYVISWCVVMTSVLFHKA